MAKFGVGSLKELKLLQEMAKLGVHENEITETFVTPSGPGGQKRQKTSSCVYLRHEPTGIEVKCQRERSQAINRYVARQELCEKIDALIHGRKSKKSVKIDKQRKQKDRRKRRSRNKKPSPSTGAKEKS